MEKFKNNRKEYIYAQLWSQCLKGKGSGIRWEHAERTSVKRKLGKKTIDIYSKSKINMSGLMGKYNWIFIG